MTGVRCILIRHNDVNIRTKDFINASAKKDAILLNLSENDIFFNQPDSPTDSLWHLLRTMAGHSSEKIDDLLKVHRQARTKLSTIESIFKDKDALMIYSLPHMFQVT